MNDASPLLGQLRLQHVLRRGGMSEVWLAHDEWLGAPVAVKIIERASDAQAQRRLEEAFQREVRAIASLDHPYIVSVLDWGQVELGQAAASGGRLTEGSLYLVMEYAAGGSLQELEHELSWPQIRTILLRLLEALAHAHAREVIHRDLKPGNVLLRAGKGSVEEVVLSDFGLALGQAQLQDSSAHHVLGTRAYMAPEQITNDWRDQGPWTDLYALGCLAWTLLHGQPPFTGEDILKAHLEAPLPRCSPRQAAPDRIGGWLRTLLAKNPRDRFRFAAEAARELLRMDSLSAGQPTLRGWGERVRSQPQALRLGQGLGLLELRPAPMVGRQAERAALWQRVEEAVEQRRPKLILLSGERGVGKSRLAQWLVHRAVELGVATTLRAQGGPERSLHEAIGQMLRDHLRCAELDQAQVAARVARAVRRLSWRGDEPATRDQDIQTLTQLISGRLPQTPQEREATHAALSRQMARMAAHRPLLVWLDELRGWPQLLALLQTLRELTPTGAIVFVVTLEAWPLGQDEEAQLAWQTLCQDEAVTLHRVEPLDALAQAALIQHLLPLAAPLARQVERLAEGNPLFTIELVHALIARDALEKSAEGWRLRPEATLEIPTTISTLLLERVEATLRGVSAWSEAQRDQARQALELAACLGPQVFLAEWSAACRHAGLDAPESLVEQAVRAGLAQWSEVGFDLEHGLLGLCLEAEAARGGRAQGHHAACAAMLRERYGEQVQAVAERLAKHLLHAQQTEQALELLLSAMETRRLHGEFTHGHALYEAWVSGMRALGPRADALAWGRGELARVRLLLTQGAMPEAQAAMAHADALATHSGDAALMAEALMLRGWMARKTGALALTREHLEAARALFDSSQDHEGLGRCLVALGELYVTLGDGQAAMRTLSEAVARLEAQQNHHELGRAFMVLSELAYSQLDEYHGDVYLERALAQFQREGNSVALSQAYNFQGEMARRRGDLDQAMAHYRRALAMMRTTASREVVIPCLNLLFTLLARRDYAEAAQLIPSVWRVIEREGWQPYEGCLRLGRLCCEGDAGRFEGWPAQLELIEEGLSRSGLIEADVAELAEHAAELAERGEQPALFARVLRLAISQREGLHQHAQAQALRRRLA